MKKNEIIELLKTKCNGYDLPLSLNIELIAEVLVNKQEEAINYTRCSLQLPDDLEPVLAKIQHVNDLGKSSWYEVVYNDGNWRSYKGSNTFEDGEKVVKWKYCKAIV